MNHRDVLRAVMVEVDSGTVASVAGLAISVWKLMKAVERSFSGLMGMTCITQLGEKGKKKRANSGN